MSVTDVASFTRSAANLLVCVSVEGPSTVIALRGEPDIGTVPAVIDVFIDVITDRTGDVVVDLSQTDFIDSATVHVLARARKFLAERDRRLTIRSPSQFALLVLTIHDLSVEPWAKG